MPTCIKYRKIKYQQEDFLGPDICNSAMVRDSKLSEQKHNELEQEISIYELDISAAQGYESGAGMDGLSNCFIIKKLTSA